MNTITPRTDAAYLSADGDNHERVSAMLAVSEKLERENTKILEALENAEIALSSMNPKHEGEEIVKKEGIAIIREALAGKEDE